MPVEIKELVIRAVIPAGQAIEEKEIGSDLLDRDDSRYPQSLVQECVRQVLNILRKERAR